MKILVKLKFWNRLTRKHLPKRPVVWLSWADVFPDVWFEAGMELPSLNLKKNSYNNPKCGQMRRLRIHSTVQMTKISLIRQSSNKTETFYFTLKTWLPFQLRRRSTCHPVKNMHILNPMNKTAARHPHLKTVNLSKTEDTGTHTALFSGIDRKDKERKQSSCRQNPFTV